MQCCGKFGDVDDQRQRKQVFAGEWIRLKSLVMLRDVTRGAGQRTNEALDIDEGYLLLLMLQDFADHDVCAGPSAVCMHEVVIVKRCLYFRRPWRADQPVCSLDSAIDCTVSSLSLRSLQLSCLTADGH